MDHIEGLEKRIREDYADDLKDLDVHVKVIKNRKDLFDEFGENPVMKCLGVVKDVFIFINKKKGRLCTIIAIALHLLNALGFHAPKPGEFYSIVQRRWAKTLATESYVPQERDFPVIFNPLWDKLGTNYYGDANPIDYIASGTSLTISGIIDIPEDGYLRISGEEDKET